MKDNEYLRLNAVDRFKTLDAGIVKDLNELVSLAAAVCQTPVALVTLLDKDVQWFKASVGTEVECTPRSVSFCNNTIKQTQLVIIPDLLADPNHKTNPLVTGEPYVRFYAGSPLITKDGFAIGSLCVIDMEPRGLTEHQKKALKTLASQVVNLMELQWSLNNLEHQYQKEHEQIQARKAYEIKLRAVFDSSNDTHILVGRNYDVLAFNRSASIFLRSHYKHNLCIGDSILTYTEPAVLNQFKKYFSIALSGRSIKREWRLMPGTPLECWKVTTFVPVRDDDGIVIGVSLNSTDITHRKRQEAYINVQNEALQRIAMIQSHELRRPVASLMGIMDLLKMENIYFNYFEMMELTVNELDEKIRGIVKDSEDTLQGRHLAIVA
ncbi:GAF domain-containing protein [Mucilaginibacter psychrotolerans]|uniref:GAF domain-containing protein n=1 Tax=Mucilaginibacter psychrotolerans TaxID=1524096 RepID=A0A4Y8S755_9SPHI|nr:PAS domain S-box protein [Mucilaginibacter psychrotolerans]TFF34768.1 GAF domain-containing protein [Mucilaginibacter psychrotolerans]